MSNRSRGAWTNRSNFPKLSKSAQRGQLYHTKRNQYRGGVPNIHRGHSFNYKRGTVDVNTRGRGQGGRGRAAPAFYYYNQSEVESQGLTTDDAVGSQGSDMDYEQENENNYQFKPPLSGNGEDWSNEQVVHSRILKLRLLSNVFDFLNCCFHFYILRLCFLLKI